MNSGENLSRTNLTGQKRKSFSDNSPFCSLLDPLLIHQTPQIDFQCPTKKIKSVDEQRISSTDNDKNAAEMMICENSIDIQTRQNSNQTAVVHVPQHCNRICNADASPTSFIIRCYCDPYRLNEFIPYESDIY